MLKQFFKYIFQSIAGMIGISVYILADTFFISVHSGADGLAVLNLILPVYGVVYAIGAMIGIGSAPDSGSTGPRGKIRITIFSSLFSGAFCAVCLLSLQGFLHRRNFCIFLAQMRD